MIQIFTHPEIVLNNSKTIIKNRIKKCTKKNYSLKKLEERAIQLIDAAMDSYPAIDADDYQCELIRQYAARVLRLDGERERLVDEMRFYQRVERNTKFYFLSQASKKLLLAD